MILGPSQGMIVDVSSERDDGAVKNCFQEHEKEKWNKGSQTLTTVKV